MHRLILPGFKKADQGYVVMQQKHTLVNIRSLLLLLEGCFFFFFLSTGLQSRGVVAEK